MTADEVGILATALGVIASAIFTFIRSGKTDRMNEERADLDSDASRLKEALERIDKLEAARVADARQYEADRLTDARRFRLLEDYTRICRAGLEKAGVDVPDWPEGLK